MNRDQETLDRAAAERHESRDERVEEAYVVLLERLAESRGVEMPEAPAVAVARTRRAYGGDWESAWQDRLPLAVEELGFVAQCVWASAAEMAGALRPGQPAVLFRRTEGNPLGWTLLLDRRWGGSVFRADLTGAGRDEWVGLADLARSLGASGDQRLPWLVCDPVFPSEENDEQHDPSSTPPARRLAQLLRPDRGDLFSIVVFGLLVGALTLATPLAVQQLVNSVALGGLLQPVIVLALLLLAVLSFSAALSALQSYVAEIVQRRIFVRVVADLAHRLPRVQLEAFDRRHGPEVVNRFFDVVTVQKVGSILLLDGVALVLQTMIGLLVLSFYHPLMLAFSMVLLAGIAVVTFVFGRGAVPTAIEESRSKYAVQGWLEELARHAPQLKTAGAARFAMEHADGLARQYLRARATHYRIVFRQLVGALGLQVVANSALLGLGGGLVIVGQLTLGQLVASELIVTVIVAAFAKLGKHLESFYDLLAASDKLGVLFDLPLERSGGTVLEPREEGLAVAFHGVGFAYDETPVLDGFDLAIAPGERIALVGPSGVGKSTVFDLVQGLRLPDRGYVTLDENDLREVRLDSVREQIARVSGAEIIEGSVEDNVRMGREHVTGRMVREAIRSVGLLDTLLVLPEGLDTRLSSGGLPLSQGAALRVALARAIAGRPRLILLEGALVELDAESRRRSLDALFAPDAPWTLLVACAGGENTERCDRVVSLDRGALRAPMSTSETNGAPQ